MGLSKIEWTNFVFNPWIGCQHVSPGCDHCYAETQNAHRRWNGGTWGPGAPRTRTSPAYWRQPHRWNRDAERSGVRQKVFCASLADVFDNQVDPAWRCDLWDLIAETLTLDWLLLTKRPQNIRAMLPHQSDGALMDWANGYPNVWLGTTIENCGEGMRRGYALASVPAVKRFWSCEPLIGDLGDCTSMCLRDTAVDGRPAVSWVICGGESGPGARPMDPAWARSLRDQCKDAGVPFFMKQMGGPIKARMPPIPKDLMIREFPR